jgi:hypothetical protein
MGGVRIMTGLYEENFHSNPARTSANPKWRVTIFDPQIETTTKTISEISNILGGSGDTIQKIADSTGTNLHVRIQTAFPAVYIPGEHNSYAFGLLTSFQTDTTLSKAYSISPDTIVDLGPAFTFSRRFSDSLPLTVGITAKFQFRMSTAKTYSLIDLLQGKSILPSGTGGGQLDLDLGSTYILPPKPWGMDWAVGLTLNQLLGGTFKMIRFSNSSVAPTPQPRTLGIGTSLAKKELGGLTDFLAALEIQDIGNNKNGSLFRLIHLGSEIRYGVLAIRTGINQGYWAGGLGLNLKAFTLDLSTYGEEMTLNVGGKQDRRIAMKLAFQI